MYINRWLKRRISTYLCTGWQQKGYTLIFNIIFVQYILSLMYMHSYSSTCDIVSCCEHFTSSILSTQASLSLVQCRMRILLLYTIVDLFCVIVFTFITPSIFNSSMLQLWHHNVQMETNGHKNHRYVQVGLYVWQYLLQTNRWHSNHTPLH
jgi:hypothetical protein